MQGILNEVLKYKLIFIETPDAVETSAALENYRRARKIDVSRLPIADGGSHRRATTDGEPSCSPSLVGRSRRESTSTTTMVEP